MENIYGTHEMQLSKEGEADLHKNYKNCPKNPGHVKFIPVKSFNIEHLPKDYMDDRLFQFIKATADLTVKIEIRFTSPERPDFFPDTNEPYTLSKNRNSNVLRLGTGIMSYVLKYTEESNKGACRCHRCKTSVEPSKEWGEIGVFTATHVVFDDLEAAQAKCIFFFDSEKDTKDVVSMSGWTVDEAKIKEDRCTMEVVTCNMNFLNKLDAIWGRWRDLWGEVHNRYESARGKIKFTFIVSHPHGRSKQISLGEWVSRDEVWGRVWTKYTYTTSTCPGSSGAPVYILGFNGDWLFGRHVHGGVDSNNMNYCGAGRDLN